MIVFFSNREYRETMRDPHSSCRCHAICRKLTGANAAWPIYERPGAMKVSKWYGAFYWAACAVTSKEPRREAEDFYERTYAREVNGHPGTPEGEILPGAYKKLWKLALKRVRKLWPQARKLKNSNLW